MARARSLLADMHFTDSLLWVLEGNDRAKRFYTIDGWSPDGEARTEDVWGVDANEVRYRRMIP
jgi:hypothetical protein